jgi:hypothetical protein
MEHQMYTSGLMPENEALLISEAESMVVAAQQVEHVRQMWIDLGKGQVELEQLMPHWKAAESILMEANMLVGANEEAMQANGHAKPDHPTLEKIEDDLGSIEQKIAESTLMQGHQEPSVEVSATSTTRDDPKKGEVWASENGQEWWLLSGGGGSMVDVMLVSTGEKAQVPAGFLKRKVHDVEPSPAAVAMQEDHEQEERGRLLTTDELIVQEPEKSIEAQLVREPNEHDREFARQYAVATTDPAISVTYASSPTSPDTSIPDHDDEGDERYQTILEETEARYSPTGWVIPHELENPPDIMPEMLDQVSDIEAQRLHSQFNALAARAKFLHDVEDARARGCKLTRKLFMRGAKRKAKEALGNSSTITEREEWAEDNDEDVRTWGERANHHEEEARARKTFFDIYSQHVVVLSRDWTMRDKQQNN